MTAHDTTTPLLEARGLQLQRDGHCLLDAVDCHLHGGELLGVIGPNGAGKSSLLRVLAGLEPPDAGELRLQGEPLAGLPPLRRARLLGYLEQRPRLHWPLAVEDVVALGRLPHGDRDGASVAGALERTAVTALRKRAFHTLSEGEKLRVNLARVLAGQPRLLLADEPVAGLDPYYQLQTLGLLRELAGEGPGVVVVLHDLALAARYCTRLLLLLDGRVLAQGRATDVLTPANLARAYRIDAELCFDTHTLRLTRTLPPVRPDGPAP